MEMNQSSSSQPQKRPIPWEDPKFFEEQRRYIEQDVLMFDSVEEAYFFSRNARNYLQAHADLAARNPDLVYGYDRLISLTSWVATNRISTNECVDLAREHIAEALQSEQINVYEKVITHLVTLPVFDRDDVKARLRSALFENAERLTSEYLSDANGKRVEPTVGNWLRDFHAAYGSGMHDAIAIAEYLSQGAHPRKLLPQEKAPVKKLLELYERLLISSETSRGREMPLSVKLHGKSMVLRNGMLEDVKLSEKMKEVYEGVKKMMAEDRKEAYRDVIVKLQGKYVDALSRFQPIIAKVSQEHGFDHSAILREAFEHFYEGRLDEVAGRLIALAEKDGFLRVLFRPRGFWAQFAEDYIKEEFPYNPELLSEFQEKGFSPPYLTLLIRKLLSGMQEEESAMVATAISTELERHGHAEYAGMGYADLDWVRFVWGEPTVLEGKLELLEADPPDDAIGLTEMNQELPQKFSFSWLKEIRKKSPPPVDSLPPSGESQASEVEGTQPPALPTE